MSDMSGKNNPMYGKHHSKEVRERQRKAKIGKYKGENNPMYGKHHTKETREKISLKLTGTHLSKETINKIQKSRSGKYTGENAPMYGKHHTKETREKISLAVSGENHPNFGRHWSEETIVKMRSARLGKSLSKETREKISLAVSGENHPNFGRHWSEETREKQRKAKIGKYDGKNNPMYGKSKEKSPNWKGGTSFYPYCEKFNERRKQSVRNFFNGYCICSGIHQNDCSRKHSVHHVDHDKDQGCNGKPFNLIPMCAEHHSKEMHNEENYKTYINKTLREGFKWGIWSEQEYIEKVMY